MKKDRDHVKGAIRQADAPRSRNLLLRDVLDDLKFVGAQQAPLPGWEMDAVRCAPLPDPLFPFLGREGERNAHLTHHNIPAWPLIPPMVL
eukprot:29371-Pyramimonas_sp.AAC.1